MPARPAPSTLSGASIMPAEELRVQTHDRPLEARAAMRAGGRVAAAAAAIARGRLGGRLARAATSSRRTPPSQHADAVGAHAFDAHAGRDVLTRRHQHRPRACRREAARSLCRRASAKTPSRRTSPQVVRWPAHSPARRRRRRTSALPRARRARSVSGAGAAMTAGAVRTRCQPQCASVSAKQRQRGEQRDCRGGAPAPRRRRQLAGVTYNPALLATIRMPSSLKPLNPQLALLQPYPFERLRAIVRGRHAEPREVADQPVDRRAQTSDAAVHSRRAAPRAASGLANYPTTAGAPALREAIAGWLARRHRLPALDPTTQVLPVLGSREALFAFAQTVVDASRVGATVVVPNPFYQIYEGAALLAGATPHCVNSRRGERLRAAVARRRRRGLGAHAARLRVLARQSDRPRARRTTNGASCSSCPIATAS